MAIQEVVDDKGEVLLCYDENGNNKWNETIPFDTVDTAYELDTTGSYSTIVLMRSDLPSASQMIISLNKPECIGTIMHEVDGRTVIVNSPLLTMLVWTYVRNGP